MTRTVPIIANGPFVMNDSALARRAAGDGRRTGHGAPPGW
jgi:hypothetical protein